VKNIQEVESEPYLFPDESHRKIEESPERDQASLQPEAKKTTEKKFPRLHRLKWIGKFCAEDIHNPEGKRGMVKKLYKTLCDPNRSTDSSAVQDCVEILRYLEKILRTNFLRTRVLHDKVAAFLNDFRPNKTPLGIRIRKARKRVGWSQKQLAHHLGLTSQAAVAQYEKGLRFPNKRAIAWLKETGI